MKYTSTKIIELGSCAFRQWRANHSHCQFVHGYQLKAKFTVAGHNLDDKNWIFDFAGFKEIKSLLQSQFDHTLCVAKDDPLLGLFQSLNDAGGCQLRIMDAVGIEKTAEYCFKVADGFIKNKTNNRCWVEKVEVFEHEDNSASYGKTVSQFESIEPFAGCNIPTVSVPIIDTLTTSTINPLTPDQIASLTVDHSPGRHSTAAPVGQAPTSGLGGLFAGTRFG